MIDHVVVDVEIQRTVEETPGGWNSTDQLGVAVACVWEYRTGRTRVYGPEDISALQTRLLRADRISGYNIFNFDYLVIWGIPKQRWLDMPLKGDIGQEHFKGVLLSKTDDMLRRIWTAQGFNPDVWNKGMGGTKLDQVALATLGVGKIGHGESAPRWYQEGKIQKVVNYCADDVALERDLTDFVDRYGYVCLTEGGSKLKIPEWKGGV